MIFEPLTLQELKQPSLSPEGDYFYTVMAIEQKPKSINLKLELMTAEGRKRILYTGLYNPKEIGLFALSAGLMSYYEQGQIPSNAAIDKKGRLSLGKRDKQLKNDNSGEYWAAKNVVKKWYEKETDQPVEIKDDEIPF